MSHQGVAPSSAIGRFADDLLRHDLPGLDPDRRAATVEMIERRVGRMPSITRVGVRVISTGVDLLTRVAGADRIRRGVATARVPLLSEYPRLVRSLGYAHVWETWPDTRVDGCRP